MDLLFTIPDYTGLAAAQADGKILVVSTNATRATILRLNIDGSRDTGFKTSLPTEVRQIAAQADGKIPFSTGSGLLLRLNADGSPDKTFSPPAPIYYFLQRRGGKLVFTDQTGVRQLNADGTIDASFNLQAHSAWGLPWGLFEQPDGSLVSARISEKGGVGTVLLWNKDGTLNSNFASLTGGPYACGFYVFLASAGAGQAFVGGVSKVDGFPRRGLVRLLTNPSERDFRVFTPAEFFRSSGLSRIRVGRTGSTANAASVSFTTRDNTARAGADYVPQSGMLSFAPLEVSKEVAVPLLARAGVEACLFFNLELSNPSAGYSTIASTPIAIMPDLQIATDLLRPREDGSIIITLRGAMPGRSYSLETSTDLKNWEWVTGTTATGSTTAFDGFRPKTPPQFFRARTD